MSCSCQYSPNRQPARLGPRLTFRSISSSVSRSHCAWRSLAAGSYCSPRLRRRGFRIRAKAVQQEHNQLDPDKATPANLHRLPLGIKSGQNNRQYVWDGGRLYSIDMKDLECGQKQNRRSNLKDRWRRFQAACWSAFFPRADQVWEDYWGYTLWHTGHRLCSSMLNILSTQALLKAIGIGAKRALPAAAGINWVLKDGLGKMGRLGIAACFGSYFDANLKRFRFITALLVSVCTLLEFITPMFPNQFLLLASLANVGKSIGLTTYVSTQPAVLKSFAKSENVAELSAKQQAQQMVMDNLGLALCVAMAWATRASPQASMWAPIIAMPILTLGDISSIYNELRNTHLRMLNKERAEMVAEAWADGRPIPTPAQVSAKERVVLPPRHGSLPLALVPIESGVSSPADLARLQHRHAGQRYMLSMQPQTKRQRQAHQRRVAEAPSLAHPTAPAALDHLQNGHSHATPSSSSSSSSSFSQPAASANSSHGAADLRPARDRAAESSSSSRSASPAASSPGPMSHDPDQGSWRDGFGGGMRRTKWRAVLMVEDGAQGPDMLTGLLQAAYLKRMHTALHRSHSSLDTTGRLVPEDAMAAGEPVPIGPEWLQQQWQAERRASSPSPPRTDASSVPATLDHSARQTSSSSSSSSGSSGREAMLASPSEPAPTSGTSLHSSGSSGPHGLIQNAGVPTDRGPGSGNGHVPKPGEAPSSSSSSSGGESLAGRSSPGAAEPAMAATAGGNGVTTTTSTKPSNSSRSSQTQSQRQSLSQPSTSLVRQSGGNGVELKLVQVVEGQPVASIDDMLQESHRRALQEHKRFVKALEDAQWMTQTFMLSNTERFKYSAMS